MKHVALLLFILTLFSCKKETNFILKGNLPDSAFDGEYIFLAPLENAIRERVDSVLIANGKFTIKSQVDQPEIYVVRTRPLLRLQLQELIVVKEPGNLQATIGNNSAITGTPLNDSIQHWKEHKTTFDSKLAELRQLYNSTAEIERGTVNRQIDSLRSVAMDFHYRFIKNNRNNVVGNFVLKMMGASLSEQQREELAAEK
ncbi:MAG: DUF4369 domain-containing protein [Mangrovibacterium sp.]